MERLIIDFDDDEDDGHAVHPTVAIQASNDIQRRATATGNKAHRSYRHHAQNALRWSSADSLEARKALLEAKRAELRKKLAERGGDGAEDTRAGKESLDQLRKPTTLATKNVLVPVNLPAAADSAQAQPQRAASTAQRPLPQVHPASSASLRQGPPVDGQGPIPHRVAAAANGALPPRAPKIQSFHEPSACAPSARPQGVDPLRQPPSAALIHPNPLLEASSAQHLQAIRVEKARLLARQQALKQLLRTNQAAAGGQEGQATTNPAEAVMMHRENHVVESRGEEQHEQQARSQPQVQVVKKRLHSLQYVRGEARSQVAVPPSFNTSGGGPAAGTKTTRAGVAGAPLAQTMRTYGPAAAAASKAPLSGGIGPSKPAAQPRQPLLPRGHQMKVGTSYERAVGLKKIGLSVMRTLLYVHLKNNGANATPMSFTEIHNYIRTAPDFRNMPATGGLASIDMHTFFQRSMKNLVDVVYRDGEPHVLLKKVDKFTKKSVTKLCINKVQRNMQQTRQLLGLKLLPETAAAAAAAAAAAECSVPGRGDTAAVIDDASRMQLQLAVPPASAPAQQQQQHADIGWQAPTIQDQQFKPPPPPCEPPPRRPSPLGGGAFESFGANAGFLPIGSAPSQPAFAQPPIPPPPPFSPCLVPPTERPAATQRPLAFHSPKAHNELATTPRSTPPSTAAVPQALDEDAMRNLALAYLVLREEKRLPPISLAAMREFFLGAPQLMNMTPTASLLRMDVKSELEHSLERRGLVQTLLIHGKEHYVIGKVHPPRMEQVQQLLPALREALWRRDGTAPQSDRAKRYAARATATPRTTHAVACAAKPTRSTSKAAKSIFASSAAASTSPVVFPSTTKRKASSASPLTVQYTNSPLPFASASTARRIAAIKRTHVQPRPPIYADSAPRPALPPPALQHEEAAATKAEQCKQRGSLVLHRRQQDGARVLDALLQRPHKRLKYTLVHVAELSGAQLRTHQGCESHQQRGHDCVAAFGRYCDGDEDEDGRPASPAMSSAQRLNSTQTGGAKKATAVRCFAFHSPLLAPTALSKRFLHLSTRQSPFLPPSSQAGSSLKEQQDGGGWRSKFATAPWSESQTPAEVQILDALPLGWELSSEEAKHTCSLGHLHQRNDRRVTSPSSKPAAEHHASVSVSALPSADELDRWLEDTKQLSAKGTDDIEGKHHRAHENDMHLRAPTWIAMALQHAAAAAAADEEEEEEEQEEATAPPIDFKHISTANDDDGVVDGNVEDAECAEDDGQNNRRRCHEAAIRAALSTLKRGIDALPSDSFHASLLWSVYVRLSARTPGLMPEREVRTAVTAALTNASPSYHVAVATAETAHGALQASYVLFRGAERLAMAAEGVLEIGGSDGRGEGWSPSGRAGYGSYQGAPRRDDDDDDSSPVDGAEVQRHQRGHFDTNAKAPQCTPATPLLASILDLLLRALDMLCMLSESSALLNWVHLWVFAADVPFHADSRADRDEGAQGGNNSSTPPCKDPQGSSPPDATAAAAAAATINTGSFGRRLLLRVLERSPDVLCMFWLALAHAVMVGRLPTSAEHRLGYMQDILCFFKFSEEKVMMKCSPAGIKEATAVLLAAKTSMLRSEQTCGAMEGDACSPGSTAFKAFNHALEEFEGLKQDTLEMDCSEEGCHGDSVSRPPVHNSAQHGVKHVVSTLSRPNARTESDMEMSEDEAPSPLVRTAPTGPLQTAKPAKTFATASKDPTHYSLTARLRPGGEVSECGPGAWAALLLQQRLVDFNGGAKDPGGDKASPLSWPAYDAVQTCFCGRSWLHPGEQRLEKTCAEGDGIAGAVCIASSALDVRPRPLEVCSDKALKRCQDTVAGAHRTQELRHILDVVGQRLSGTPQAAVLAVSVARRAAKLALEDVIEREGYNDMQQGVCCDDGSCAAALLTLASEIRQRFGRGVVDPFLSWMLPCMASALVESRPVAAAEVWTQVGLLQNHLQRAGSFCYGCSSDNASLL
jgi:hypothetical protein